MKQRPAYPSQGNWRCSMRLEVAMTLAATHLDRRTPKPQTSKSAEQTFHDNQVTEKSFDMVVGSNFKGAYFTIQKSLPLLRPGSSIVINASVGARKGGPTTSTVS